MKSYDTYGVAASCLWEALAKVESALRIKMRDHESTYLGDYFQFRNSAGEAFVLFENYSQFDKDWQEPDFRDHRFLLYVEETERSEDLRLDLEAVEGVGLLRHLELE